MTVAEVYYITKDKLNKLVSNNQQDIPFHIFVQNFNEQQLHWVSNCYKLAEKDSSEISKIQQLLVPHKELINPSNKGFYYEFDFPSNYFKYSSSLSEIDACPNILENHLKEQHNIGALLKNPDWSPSLKFEETLITISNNKFQVYSPENTKINKLVLSYYRTPIRINMKDGFEDFDGNITKDVDPEWINDNLEEIIDLTAKQIASNYADLVAVQAQSNHIQETQIRI